VRRRLEIQSVFYASFESPELHVLWRWMNGRHVLTAMSPAEDFRLVATTDVNAARTTFDRLISS